MEVRSYVTKRKGILYGWEEQRKGKPDVDLLILKA